MLKSKKIMRRSSLEKHGLLNPHPKSIQDELFAEEDFFDPNDLVQVRYEMLRRVWKESQTVTETAAKYGVSRATFYQTQLAFEAEGITGLMPQKRGPRRAHKLTDEVVDFMERSLEKKPQLNAHDLARTVEEIFGFKVHPRSVERAIDRRKKKRLFKQKG